MRRGKTRTLDRMAIAATRLTAALTGAWTTLGVGTFEIWEKHHSLETTAHNVAFLAIAVVFFFVPCFLFVIGPRSVRFGIRDIVTREYWVDFGQVGIRMVCWLVGGAVFGFVYFPLLEWLNAI